MGSQLEWRENSEKTSSQIALFDDFELSKQDKRPLHRSLKFP